MNHGSLHPWIVRDLSGVTADFVWAAESLKSQNKTLRSCTVHCSPGLMLGTSEQSQDVLWWQKRPFVRYANAGS